MLGADRIIPKAKDILPLVKDSAYPEVLAHWLSQDTTVRKASGPTIAGRSVLAAVKAVYGRKYSKKDVHAIYMNILREVIPKERWRSLADVADLGQLELTAERFGNVLIDLKQERLEECRVIREDLKRLYKQAEESQERVMLSKELRELRQEERLETGQATVILGWQSLLETLLVQTDETEEIADHLRPGGNGKRPQGSPRREGPPLPPDRL